MGLGLQVWDANSNVVMDTSTDTVKVLGEFRGTGTFTVTNPLLLTERFFYVINPPVRYANSFSGDRALYKVTVSGSTCTVVNTSTAGVNNPRAVTIIIGVY